MNITINGETYEIDRVNDDGYLPMVKCGRLEFYVARNSDEAGQAARKYWKEMAENDPKEFTCLVGEQTLIAWALGRSAGPGTAKVRSLEQWLDVCADHPEEEFASYDGSECDVDACDEELEDELGFKPTVAYRHN